MPVEHWYPWYHGQWLGSTTRAEMSLAAQGAYRTMLDLCAANGAIPADRDKLAKLLLCERSEFDEIWHQIAPHFERENGSENELYNAKMRLVCKVQDKRRKILKANGKRGGRPKNQKVSKTDNQKVSKPEKHKEKRREDTISPKGSLSSDSPESSAVEAFDTLDGQAPPEHPTAHHWRRIVAIYPKATHLQQAAAAWVEIVEGAPDPLREADRVLEAVRAIDMANLERRFLPNLAAFIREKRYLEDWRAAANETAVHDPPVWEPPPGWLLKAEEK